MTHFLLYTGGGSLVMVVVGIAFVALVVWWTVALAVALTAVALWRLWRVVRHAYSPGGKA